MVKTTSLGFPRTGPKREMKVALEAYWNGKIDLGELHKAYDTTLQASIAEQVKAGIQLVGVGDHTMYDHVLDWSETFGLTAARVRKAGLSGLDAYFCQARGKDGIPALDMTKFFDSNYHNMVPEVCKGTTPVLNSGSFLSQLKKGVQFAKEASEQAEVTPIMLGPVTLVKLCKLEDKDEWSVLVEKLVSLYCQLFSEIKEACGSITEVQMHEPWLVKSEGSTEDVRKCFSKSYEVLCAAAEKSGLGINLCVYFDDVDKEVYKCLVESRVKRLTFDFCRGRTMLERLVAEGFPQDKQLGAGIVDGRNIWKSETSVRALYKQVKKVVNNADDRLVVSPSCSLQFVPYDVTFETQLPESLSGKLAFAVQKLELVSRVAKDNESAGNDEDHINHEDNLTCVEVGKVVPNADVEKLLSRSEKFEARRPQQIQVPLFPTTTIGSFPQTAELRRVRLAFKKNRITAEEYHQIIDAEIKKVIEAQRDIGLDVFVHGEPERSDMVEHFAERMEGMAFTQYGWVQSYGSRYVRPPVIYDTVKRVKAMTVREFKVAQDLAGETPVKGMLTGPVTILNWSFCRDDIPRSEQALEIAVAIREEVRDLEAAGCRVIQVDEAALRERVPLKQEDWGKYMEWAITSFRLSTAVAKSSTQIVTHMCYSSFEDIMSSIDDMDADVLTIENSRSGDEMINHLVNCKYSKDVGPGVYDIHSPVIPTKDELETRITLLSKCGLPLTRLWVNPDCGLKTRKWEEVIPSLTNMVASAKLVRARLSQQQ